MNDLNDILIRWVLVMLLFLIANIKLHMIQFFIDSKQPKDPTAGGENSTKNAKAPNDVATEKF